MKKKHIPVLFGAMIAQQTLSHDSVFSLGDESSETKICLAIANNNLKQYKKAVTNLSSTRNRFSLHRVVVNKLQCNSKPIIEFAETNGAITVVKFISRFEVH